MEGDWWKCESPITHKEDGVMGSLIHEFSYLPLQASNIWKHTRQTPTLNNTR